MGLWRDLFYRGLRVRPGDVPYVRVSSRLPCYRLLVGFPATEKTSLCQVVFARLHGILGGTTGSGKSGGLNVLMGNLVACRDVVIWGIDLKRGMELGPWESCIDRLATTPEEAISLLRDAVAVLEARAALLQQREDAGGRYRRPCPRS